MSISGPGRPFRQTVTVPQPPEVTQQQLFMAIVGYRERPLSKQDSARFSSRGDSSQYGRSSSSRSVSSSSFSSSSSSGCSFYWSDRLRLSDQGRRGARRHGVDDLHQRRRRFRDHHSVAGHLGGWATRGLVGPSLQWLPAAGQSRSTPLSPEGKYWWDGTQWSPTSPRGGKPPMARGGLLPG